MMAAWIAAVAIACAAALATWRSARRRGWRSGIVWVQPLVALALYLTLFPPQLPLRAGALTVLTPGTTAAQVRSLPRAQRIVALPGAPAPPRAERVPDLATALRRFDDVRNVTIVGDGLPARDRDAPAGIGVTFEPAPARGLVELRAPTRVLAGSQWIAEGRVAAPATAVELLDPSGAVVASARAGRDGEFRIAGAARTAGPARFELRLLDARREVVERASVPVVAKGGTGVSLIVRAGAPDAELKYLLRWAVDAGLDAHSAVGVSPEVALRTGDAELTAETLASADLVVIDERAWLALTESERQALDAAVYAGLGLLLRTAGPVDESVAADWARFGYRVEGAGEPHSVTLDRALGLDGRTSFTASPVRLAGTGAVPLLAADDGETVATWRAYGRGRVGAWMIVDSYDLVLLGDASRHGTLWSRTISTLARARPAGARPRLPIDAWVGERAVICSASATVVGGTEAASTSGNETDDRLRIVDPDGNETALIQDANGCGAYWPAIAGWHRLDGTDETFYVRDPDDGATLRAAENAHATTALVAPLRDVQVASVASVPMPRWPFFLAWLLVAGGLWWRERSAAS